MTEAVRIKNLVKSFGDLVAVNDVTFEVHAGEVFALLGPNGAGKTTALKVLMGLLDADSGSAEVYGTDSSADPVGVKKLVGYVPEERNLYESLTPRELFAFIGSIRELPSDMVSRRVSEMAKALDFTQYYDSMIVTLSHGNKQKILLMAALMHTPKLLILDEPFSGLDVLTTRIMKDIVKIHTEQGGAVLLSTHIMEVAEGLCHRVGIIDEGKLIAIGSLEELRVQAEQEGATLEKLFLKLTEQEDEVREGVDALRGALAE